MTVAEMQKRFGIAGAVMVAKGRGGIPAVALSHKSGAEAEISLLGAHVTSWCTPDGEERFFLSRYSEFKEGMPIRGGVPVIFPQFGMEGPYPKHGFARTCLWRLERTNLAADGVVTAAFTLVDSSITRAVWPFSFRLDLEVCLAETLTMTLNCRNSDTTSFLFTMALHTYFSVADIAKASVEGLNGLLFRDRIAGNTKSTETREAVTFDGEVDRIYVRAPAEVVLRDGEANRTLRIRQQNMPDVVVWNPWLETARELPDFATEEYKEMVCVENCVIERPVELRPGDNWTGTTEFIPE